MTRIVLTLLALSLATSAEAHTGIDHAATIMTGLMHPLGGVDHIAAMLAVGVWSAVAGGAARLWAWPLAFVVAMLFGALIGAAGVTVPFIEPMIAASVVAAGLLVVMAVQAPATVGMVVVAAFAAMHGIAHGVEAPAGPIAPYVAGFALATAGLHALGISFALLAERLAGLLSVRVVGALVAATGVALLIR